MDLNGDHACPCCNAKINEVQVLAQQSYHSPEAERASSPQGRECLLYRNLVSFNGIHPAGQEILCRMSGMVRRQDSTCRILGSSVTRPTLSWMYFTLIPFLPCLYILYLTLPASLLGLGPAPTELSSHTPTDFKGLWNRPLRQASSDTANDRHKMENDSLAPLLVPGWGCNKRARLALLTSVWVQWPIAL